MPSIILKKYSSPEEFKRTDLTAEDSSKPYSFSEWIERNYGIVPNNSEDQYKKYLLDWYSNKSSNLEVKSLKEDYINLLKSLSVIFRNDEEFRRFSNIDFEDDVQLKLAIPHYVRKLKEIALYYLEKREAVKKAKLKYNMIGSFNAVERTFHEYIQKAFSKRNYKLNVPEQSAWNAFPDLSSINSQFSIEIEELYDDTDYFRPELSSNSTGLYEFSTSNPLLFVLEDFIDSEYNVVDLESVPLSARQVPINTDCNSFLKLNEQSLQDLNEKYIGVNKFYLTGGLYVEDEIDVTLDFQRNNNFFYWFSGEHFKEAPHANYLDVPINSIDWVTDGATISQSYSSSDLIFVNNNDTIKGAWLAEVNEILVDDEMKTTLKANKYFKFPYPGTGLSSEGTSWTGKSIIDLDFYKKSFFPNQTYLDKLSNDLLKLYWNESDSISSVVTINVNDTTLVTDGAYASKKYKNSDKIFTRTNTGDDKLHDANPDEIYKGDINIAWLYDFDRTELPILEGTNKIYWPLQTYENLDELYFEYKHGLPIRLNDIDVGQFAGSVAATDINEADMIFKLATWCGPITEAAWLKGTPLSAFNSCSTTTNEITATYSIDTQWNPAKLAGVLSWWNSDINIGTKSWTDMIYNNTLSADVLYYDDDSRSVVLGKNNLAGTIQSPSIKQLSIPTDQPYMVAAVFNPALITDKRWVVNNSNKNIGIAIINGNLYMTQDGNSIKSSVSVVADQWYYAIAIFNGKNSVFIVNGTSNYGQINNAQFDQLILGSDYNNNKLNNYIGRYRDVIFYKGVPTLDETKYLKIYLNNLLGDSPIRPVGSIGDTSDITTFNRFLSTQVLTIKEGDFVKGAVQAGLTFKAESGVGSRFIWTGENEEEVNINNIEAFTGKNHDSICKYRNLKKKPLDSVNTFLDKDAINQWKECDCKSIIYSPFGKTGEFSTDGNIPDYILLDTDYPNTPNLDSWIGSDGLTWRNSKDFAWFKLDSDNIDGRIGWGKGTWITNTGQPFKLKAGKTYVYFRNGVKGCGEDNPFLVIKHAYCSCVVKDCDCNTIPCRPVWMKAKLVNDTWVDTGELSEMTLNSNNFYEYLHKGGQYFSKIIEEDNVKTEIKDCIPSLDFLLSVDIQDAKPYWAYATYLDKTNGMVYADRYDTLSEYLTLLQPKPSDVNLTDNLYFEYKRSECADTTCFNWVQPLTWKVKTQIQRWNKLIIDSCVESEVLNYTQKSNCESCESFNKECETCCRIIENCGCIIDKCVYTRTGLSASDEESDISLSTRYEGRPVFVNYYARTPYTLSFKVVDTTNGVPPYGGKWIEPDLIDYATALSPHQNIVNITHPIVASNQISSDLYPSYTIGFFKPDKLGYTSLFLHKKDINLTLSNDRTIDSFDIVIDPEHYISGPYSVKSVDSSWMKYKSSCINGEIKNANLYQKFIPYQSEYESLGFTTLGIQTQSDIKSPWVGNKSDKFINDSRFTPNYRNQIPVNCGPNSWYSNTPSITGIMTQWRMDVYGNQYGLYKEDSYTTIFDRDNVQYGKLWVKDLIGNVAEGYQLLSSVFDTYTSNDTLQLALTGGQIIDFEMYYDTMFILTDSNILFERVTLDYDTGEIYSTADESNLFSITSASDYLGSWLNEKNKLLTFSYITTGLSGNYPIIYNLDIDASKYIKIFPLVNSDYEEWDINFDYSKSGKISYNLDTNKVNITFIASVSGTEKLVVSNFYYYDNTTLKVEDVKILNVPNLSSKELLKTNFYSDKLLLIFEEQTSPNKVYQVLIDN